MWFPRLLEPIVKDRVATRPAVVLTGARQTGKTSLVKRLFPKYNYVTLDLPSAARQAEFDPKTFLNQYKPPLIVDEIQYAPGLLRHLKQEIDRDRTSNGKFILTGSQPFELMQGVSESLAGRASVLELNGLSFSEIKGKKSKSKVDEYLLRGGYPELHEKPELDAYGFFQSYVATYLERDLRSMLKVGNLHDFERFLRACALRTSQLINRAELARDIGISPSTAGEWLSVLQRSGIIYLLEPWFSNKTKTLVKSPKLHFCDTGLCAFLMGIQTMNDLYHSPLLGSLWETLVFNELHRLTSAKGGWQLHYWRDRTKEADFLLHKAGRYILADAKWSENPSHTGKLPRIQMEFEASPPTHLICRSANAFPISDKIQATPIKDLQSILYPESP